MSSIFKIADDTIIAVVTAEKDVASNKGAAKASTDAANKAKIGAYANIIAAISGQKLVKGNLPRAVSNELRKALTESAGLKDALVKRYIENSVGALRLRTSDNQPFIPSQATPEMVLDLLLADDITSEAKLAKRVKGADQKDEIRALAEALVGKFTTRKNDEGERVQGVFKPSDFDAEDWVRFDNIVRELKAARAAAEDAAAQAEAKIKAENDDINDALAGMGV
jgi:hypothetical protein